MKTDSNIEIVIRDVRIVPIPVEDKDTDSDYVDPSNATDIEYVITTYRGGGEEVLKKTLADGIEVVQASNAINESSDKPTSLMKVPDDQNIIRVELSPEDTGGLPDDGDLYHECQIEGIRGGPSTVMQGEVKVRQSATGRT